MAAALATLTVLRRHDGPAQMRAMGERLRDGLRRAGPPGMAWRIRQSGPAQMPLMLFDGDADYARGAFCAAALRAAPISTPSTTCS